MSPISFFFITQIFFMFLHLYGNINFENNIFVPLDFF